MKPSERTGEKIRLIIESDDPVVEFYVIDGQFNLVEKGYGNLDTHLPPGLYKVKFKSGAVTKEEEAVLEPGSKTVRVRAPALDFSTSAPIAHTRTARPEHLSLAHELSRQVHESFGSGAQLFLFVRDLEEGVKTDPAQGLTLRSLNGKLLADFRETGERDLQQQWAGATLDVEPGIYRLRLEAHSAGVLEQTLVVTRGWQTQVFLMRRPFGVTERRARRADLTNASILMTHLGDGFNPDREDMRWTEQARQSLSSGRSLLAPRDLYSMLWSKYRNPMLGIFCAHLLLLSKESHPGMFEDLVENLRRILGEHPDVNALALRMASPEAEADITVPPYTAPPMLRNSWDIVVQSSAEKPELVPPSSLAELVSGHLWGGGAWLVWQSPPDPRLLNRRPGEDLPALSEAIPQLEDILYDSEGLEDFIARRDLDEMEESLLRYMVVQKPEPRAKGIVMPGDMEYVETTDPLSDDSVIKALGVPNTAARKAAASLIEKLGGKRRA